jgi:hypothetical protein
MHAGPVDGFHWERRKSGEVIVVLHRRLMMRIVPVVSMPSTTMILERFLVVVMVVMLVIHLQLAHVELQLRYGSGVSVRVREQVTVLDRM